jgi:hypothetical protein
VAGLSLPELLRTRAEAASRGGAKNKSCILLWMAGGPSHIDTWDSKPDRPPMNRGPFGVTQTKLPGVVICEHLPKQAAMLDKFTIIRSVDAQHSNHEPNKVFQTGNLRADPRRNHDGYMYPSIGSVVAKHRGATTPAVPPYVVFMRSRSRRLRWLARQAVRSVQGNLAAKLPSTTSSVTTPAVGPTPTCSSCR